ncbi:protein YIPF5-like protein [Leptotrombidium deliense]|uniref:Protein YIPF n=1 Tax=Leptotrombidium deliense TaxID=299467 RepID=A0A443S8Z7_9ACAR|nr:protein YIPF5-like protein [Leptotrombidium deliense]
MSYYANDDQRYDNVGYDFGNFDYGMPQNQQQMYSRPQPAIFTPQDDQFNTNPFESKAANGGDPYADEPPLLEELGINFEHITAKTAAVLNPFRNTDSSILSDTDFAGPLVFCLALGGFLMLAGKVIFGYIYGVLVLGCLSIYALLNLMSQTLSISLSCTVSVLGYCLLPMVMLSGISVLINLKTSLIGNGIAFLAVIWCATSASKLFTTALASHNQQALIAYPCALLYVKGKLLAVIGDEDTCVGFLLGGIGEINRTKTPQLNFMVVDKNTVTSEIEETFKGFLKRDDIDIILINQNVAELIRHAIDSHVEAVPAVLEIPSKDQPYDPQKDSILRRAKGLFSAEDYR